MAVQQNKKSPSRRNMRRATQKLAPSTLTTDKTNGDRHLRHHISASGYYRGREVIAAPAQEDTSGEE